MMSPPVTNRQFLPPIWPGPLSTLSTASPPLLKSTDVHPDAVKEFPAGRARLGRDSKAPPQQEDPSRHRRQPSPTFPYNQTLSLLQSAYDEYIESRGITNAFNRQIRAGRRSLRKAQAASRASIPFFPHTSWTCFRYDLPADAVVALFADGGYGEAPAQRVHAAIRGRTPTHAIHLGDVYFAGTPKESPRALPRYHRSVWSARRTRAAISHCPGNHDDYRAGMLTFPMPSCGAEAGCELLNLRNGKWQIIGPRLGLQEYGHPGPQLEWLTAQYYTRPRPRSIVLSHHQLFSTIRQARHHRHDFEQDQALLPRIYAWVLGPRTPLHHNGRSLGHQAAMHRPRQYPVQRTLRPAGSFPRIRSRSSRSHERSRAGCRRTCYHGFALLAI